MRGEFRSRKLQPVEGPVTRPTSDRLRETLFNILGTEVQDAIFVDAYAGTGAVGIEALSRGAKQAVFLEKDRLALEAIRKNLASLKAESRARIITGPVGSNLRGIQGNIIFLDPPYTKEQEYVSAFEALNKTTAALVVVQHSIRFTPVPECGSLIAGRMVKQGENALTLYRPKP